MKTIKLLLLLLLTSTTYADPAPKVLNIQQWKTTNDVDVYFVQAPELPMIDISVVYNAGAARDGNNPGVALFTNTMLKEGTTYLNTDQIATGFEDVGAIFGLDSARDMATASLRCLTEPNLLNPALDIFNKVLTKSTFNEKSFQRVQQQLLTAIKHKQQSPSSLVNDAFYQALYRDHPYAHPTLGNSQSISNMSSKNLKNFYNQYYVAQNATITIVGAVDLAQAKKIADKVAFNIRQGLKPAPLPQATASENLTQEQIKFDSQQTHIRMGQIGITRTDPDYFALTLGNHILGGGGLVSRLNQEVREKRGLSYSIYSYFLPMAEHGPFIIGLQTQNKQTKEAISVVNDTLNKFLLTGPSNEEVSLAKNNIIGSFPLRLDTNKAIADNVQMIAFYNLPMDYLDTYRDKVANTSVEDIKTAFQNRITPQKFVTISVGKNEL